MDESRFDLRQVFEEHRVQFLIALLGFFLVSIGVLSAVVVGLNRSTPQVEVISSSTQSVQDKKEIVVDVSGAVEKPGIYNLQAGSRVNDVLVVAGGLSAKADREWVSKYINLAQIVSDGIKVYIPKLGEISQEKDAAAVLGETESGSVIGLNQGKKININTASLTELDSLWGIGEKRAQAIIDNRPYASVAVLVEKRIIPSSVFERIKEEIDIF